MATNKDILESLIELKTEVSVIKERLKDYPELRKDVQDIKTTIATERVKITGIIGGLTFGLTMLFNGVVYWIKGGMSK